MRTPILALRNSRATRGQHPGLLLQRYLCENATGDGGNPEEKRAILQAAINAAGNPDVRELYNAAYNRWKHDLDRDKELTRSVDLQTVGRLIVGLGSENVLETGITLHHTYGLPVLPGSALKGLAAHYCDQVWGERTNLTPSDKARNFRGSRQEDRRNNRPAEPQGQYHKLLFGATDDGGCVIFHDGWFVPDSEKEPLKLDVMTPHHPRWLDGSVPPTDFDSPTPVPFLSVAGQFHVAVSWCGPASDRSRNWTEFALSLLRDALFHWGIGGKTTSGYGRLSKDAVASNQSQHVASDGLVEVTILEAKPKTGPNAFQVQEEGKPKGMLNHGTPPNPLPEVGAKVRVFREPTSQVNNPTYRWSKPDPQPPTQRRPPRRG